MRPLVRLLAGAVALGAVALGPAGCTTAHRVADPPGTPSPPVASPSSSGPAAPTTADHVAATRRLAAWLLHAVPMPPGAREWDHSPTDHYRRPSLGIGPADPHLARTTWWTVPASSAELTSWLRGHAPDRLRPDRDPGSSESGGVWEQDQAFWVPGTAAHTRGWVNVAYTPDGDRLAVRVDTFVGARFARTVLVPTDTTAVTIRRTERSFDHPARRHRTVRTVTAPAAVAALVDLVNTLPGAMTVPFVAPCPAMLTQRRYTMGFASPEGRYVARLPRVGCWPSVRLTHDGARAGPRLDPGRRFTATADRYLARGSGA